MCVLRQFYHSFPSGKPASSPQASGSSPACEASIALLECIVPADGESGNQVELEILDLQFFDDEFIVIVYYERPWAGASVLECWG